MSAVMLSSVSINFYQFAGTAPAAPTSGPTAATPAPAVKDHDHDDERPRFRENSLVSAMMAAFQALGVGTAAAGPTTAPATNPPAATPTATTPPAAAAGASPQVAAAATDPAVAPTTATPSTTGTAATPAATTDTLETAVNEFAHALFGMLHQQGRGEHARGGNSGEGEGHGHRHDGHHRSGYNGFAQRLQNLAQSLGTTPAATPAPAAAVGTISSTTPAAPADTTGTPPAEATSTPAVSDSPAPSRGMSRLLAAFSKVMTFLQPQAAIPSATPTTPPTTTTASAPSAADQLKLFLTTLAQSFQSGGAATPPSPVGSQLNVTA